MTTPRKKRSPNKSIPSKGGEVLPYGEMLAVIIGTVVRLGLPEEEGGEGGATAQRLHKVLAGEGYNLTLQQARVWLVNLHRDGRIDRLGRGRYAGM